MRFMRLICTYCGKDYPLDQPYQRCEDCGEPLELEHSKGNLRGDSSIWRRYAEFYPFLDQKLAERLTLGEGNTPITISEKLSEELSNVVYLKDETQNPTWSFKDRGTLIGVIRAIQLGFRKIGTVSTGNMAASLSAYGAKAGLESIILVRPDIPEEKIYPIVVYGSRLIEVEANFGEIYWKSLELGKKVGIYFINSDDPFRVEGYKTIGFEIGEWMLEGGKESGKDGKDGEIDYIVVPTGSGGLLRGIMKALFEMKSSGIISKIPKFISVQAEGCSPIAKAYEEGNDRIEPIKEPKTIAGAIADPSPPSGNEVLRKLKKHGRVLAVSDREILEAQRMLARSGIFVQPASATTIAAIRKLKDEGYEDMKFMCILTGAGIKVPSAVKEMFKFESLHIQKTDLSGLEKVLEGG
ncbi:MAG: pyridoxal-phosphate dependent enzyme [Archaeoglobus sp.]|nr:pyridoxal-phosphate dependent enzyme [Archaeoglobus sp.]